jgi:hypothetical protein
VRENRWRNDGFGFDGCRSNGSDAQSRQFEDSAASWMSACVGMSSLL